ncbi:DUF2147 domain-containing protein [Rhizobium mesoamericanum]|uniref:DUF2147 domain-containing protein n=1 Tax=Rhizobium mesoamericanum TaxID=1079800 RepID=UPI000491C6ED|nr:DUF2147 domain-containing protein [Rhizobium mesoamericanum]
MQTFNLSSRSAIAMAFVATSLLFDQPTLAGQSGPDAIIGTWKADDGSVMDMYKAGAEYRARLLYGNQVMEPDNVTFKKDEKNLDRALRSRSLEKIVLLWGLHWDVDAWTGGSIYDASSGRTYNCRAEMKDGKMLMRGYLGVSLLGQTQVFHRVDG